MDQGERMKLHWGCGISNDLVGYKWRFQSAPPSSQGVGAEATRILHFSPTWEAAWVPFLEILLSSFALLCLNNRNPLRWASERTRAFMIHSAPRTIKLD